MSRCSVIIRCYNEEEHIGRLLSGIMEQTVKEVEIIVVDSGSTDATVSIASQFPVKLLSITPEEFSFGRALNIGCEAARGDILVFASAHVYPVYKDWLELMMRPFEDPQTTLVYGKQRGNEVSRFSEREVFKKWFPDRSDLDQSHPFCNNANAAVRKALWEQLPYDEELTGLEDLDWAKRAAEMGGKIAYVADAEIIHVHDEPWNGVFNRYKREAIAFKHIYPEEQFSLGDFLRLYTRNVTSDLHHALRERVLWQNALSILIFRLMQFWGSYRGFKHHGPVCSALKQKFYYPNGLQRNNTARPSGRRERIRYDGVHAGKAA